MDFLSYCLIIPCLLSLLYFSVQAFRCDPKRLLLPPGPKPFPIIGNLLELGNKPHLSLTNLSKRYGPIISLQLGQITTVVVSSSTMAKEVLRTHDQFLCNRTVPDAVQKWRNLRKICNNQLFATKVLDANQANRHLKAVEIGRAAFKTTLNLLSRTVFSVDLADPSSEMGREFKEIVWGLMEESGKPNLGDYFPVLRKLDLQGIRRRIIKHFLKIDLLFDRMITQRLELRKSNDYVTSYDMLDSLLDISEVSNEDMDKLLIEHLFVALFVAGTDTTSATLEWAMAELLRNPEKLSKAHEELEQVIGKGKPVEESDIARLPYLQAIIKETFRLHPAVPFLIPRKAKQDVEILLVNAWAIGRDPFIWDNPTSFVPERYFGLDHQIDVLGKNFELIPFGGGRRICPGLPLAMRMLHLMLGSLINSFDWKLEDEVTPENMNMEEKFGITLEMAHPLRAVPKKTQIRDGFVEFLYLNPMSLFSLVFIDSSFHNQPQKASSTSAKAISRHWQPLTAWQ
ncbi:geraniol 8-hydroxylase-like [Pyrus ussuriensis x Pyrus communis]|uniref:Geraniol 8-hydroxylase-like n=1 Tax=Pyrus ussuriensis x Pyrus communis TaxID=2448454 RepID=A0A5N5H2P3_9ROSA|nr:geraniol 8-hydroxylase-like [Pyrus ussuriensis x Pyrus communis]